MDDLELRNQLAGLVGGRARENACSPTDTISCSKVGGMPTR